MEKHEEKGPEQSEELKQNQVSLPPERRSLKYTHELHLLNFWLQRFDLTTGDEVKLKVHRNILHNSATFQINRKLHFCGGKKMIDGKTHSLTEFFSIDYSGKSVSLRPMTKA